MPLESTVLLLTVLVLVVQLIREVFAFGRETGFWRRLWHRTPPRGKRDSHRRMKSH